MTNREWLNTLTDEELATFLIDDATFTSTRVRIGEYETLLPEQPYPRLSTIRIVCTSSILGVLDWLKQERKVVDYEKINN